MSENTERTPNLGPPWKPGESGNPKGRPIGAKDGPRAEFNRLLRQEASPEMLRKFAKKLGSTEGNTNASLMAQVHFAMILKGDMAAIKEAYAQAELPHPKNVSLTGIDGEPIQNKYMVEIVDAPPRQEVEE